MKSTLDRDPFVLLDDSRSGPASGGARLYTAPRDIIICRDHDAVPAAFARLEAALAEGRHVAGWCAYELGYGFEPRLRPLAPPPDPLPLLWLGVFDEPRLLSPADAADLLDPVRHSAAFAADIADLQPGISRERYLDCVRAIKNYLLDGDIYQANFTYPLNFMLEGTPFALYRRLRAAQPVAHAAWIHMADADILSASPELFVERRGSRVTARPMKGTAPRGRTASEDDARAAALAADEKSRAENVMIVDLLRNDLSRIAVAGSVATPRLFEVERYRTLLQMTSTVTAQVAPDLSMETLFRSLFPCGSVTGAPKIRAMEVIRELEATPRGVYTGAIGYITPERDFCFSVPIRTLTLVGDGGPARWRGRIGIGSGIVSDSDPQAEYEECRLKSRFLTAPQPAFDLLETFLWTPDQGYPAKDRHLARLEASARYFGWPCPAAKIAGELDALAAVLPSAPHRIRLLLGEQGSFAIQAVPFDPTPPVDPVVRIAAAAVASTDPLLYHKTTHRIVYDRAVATARNQGPCFEALLVNERGELTEGSFTNLFVEKHGEKHGRLLTPPVSAGLLPGILRAQLLESGRAVEATLRPEDLKGADRLYVGNSLRGLIPVTLR